MGSSGLVSVIVPVYNAERFLTDCVESIAHQSYRPLEVLVADDGSDDASWRIAGRLQRSFPEVLTLRHAENSGPAFTRNAAMRTARGGLVTFLDADDVMPPGRLAFQVDYLRERPDVDIVIGKEELIIEPGVDLPGWAQQPLDRHPPFYPMSMMARREVFERVGTFDESLRIGSDADWMFRASAAGCSIAMVPRMLVRRRIHGANLTYHSAELRETILTSLRARIADRRAPS